MCGRRSYGGYTGRGYTGSGELDEGGQACGRDAESGEASEGADKDAGCEGRLAGWSFRQEDAEYYCFDDY